MQRHLARWDRPTFPWSAAALKALAKLTSSTHPTFHPCQQAAVNLAQSGYSLFLQLPTGGGKSVCFQVPSLLELETRRRRVTLVVGPLRALLDDQKKHLTRLGLASNVTFLSPGNVPDAIADSTALLYTTPEMLLQNPRATALVTSLVASDRLARLVLDEAHCVLEWGNTFRPSYLDVARFRKTHLPHLPVTFLTATAAPDLVRSTATLFGLHAAAPAPAARDPPPDVSSTMVAIHHMLDRTNLHLRVLPKPKDAVAAIASILLGAMHEPALVFVLTQKDAVSVAKALAALGVMAHPYHAGMSEAARRTGEQMWASGKTTVLVATVAFGMGIDRPDVRHVIHHAMPLSLSAYMQQIGRAGRDGQPATCTLLYSPGDRTKAEFIASGGDGFADASAARGIQDVVNLATSTDCRREILYGHFGHGMLNDVCCRNCNCGERLDDDDDKEEDLRTRRRVSGGSSRGRRLDVELLYQKLRQAAARSGRTRKDNLLSRQTIEAIMMRPPASLEDLAAMRGVGDERAAASFDILMAHFKATSRR
ncbi:Aste57867_25112 [Aphanomyces stellatus]|uniref:DNA 3'-5' helicase n=1 Tax=Aphanomyces stellatus TaxID=120398 RepID=A0A485LSB0_9STRA|nr:hypothetical protein As57867_025034 [Aphanomyces stellatus]VFU01743.1 Aste57867_25112 [Aphanomyces stellatus]